MPKHRRRIRHKSNGADTKHIVDFRFMVNDQKGIPPSKEHAHFSGIDLDGAA